MFLLYSGSTVYIRFSANCRATQVGIAIRTQSARAYSIVSYPNSQTPIGILLTTIVLYYSNSYTSLRIADDRHTRVIYRRTRQTRMSTIDANANSDNRRKYRQQTRMSTTELVVEGGGDSCRGSRQQVDSGYKSSSFT